MLSPDCESRIDLSGYQRPDPCSGLPLSLGISSMLRLVEGSGLHHRLPQDPSGVLEIDKSVTMLNVSEEHGKKITVFSVVRPDHSAASVIVNESITPSMFGGPNREVTVIDHRTGLGERSTSRHGPTQVFDNSQTGVGPLIEQATAGQPPTLHFLYGRSAPVKRI